MFKIPQKHIKTVVTSTIHLSYRRRYRTVHRMVVLLCVNCFACVGTVVQADIVHGAFDVFWTFTRTVVVDELCIVIVILIVITVLSR